MAASTFSYAQAAKGMSTPTTASKPVSGAVTPAKDAAAPTSNGSVTSAPSWADDAENETLPEQPTEADAQPQTSSATPAVPVQSLENSSISSPDLGASSVSTVTKDDDVSSLPNASSESTWDNKSQASTSVDKSVEPAEKTSDKVKKGKAAVLKPLQEAPLPAVNIWKKRADELKSKTQRPASSPLSNGAAQVAVKKNESDVKGQSATLSSRTKGQEEEKIPHGRKDTRIDGDSKKDSKVKPAENAQAPPPKRDQESWPTPDIAIDEDRKKAQEKGDKVEKERKESTSNGSHGKQEWVKVPYTPSVVFNTPLPNAANPRRGGRPGGRGGAQPGGRPSTYAANGAGQPEKDGSASTSITNGDNTKRDRTEVVAPRESSPKDKRAGSAASPTLPASTVEKSSKPMGLPSSEVEFRPRTSASAPDSQAPSQNGAYPRQYPTRGPKPRRGDMSFGGERRRDGDVSPTKDNTLDDRRTSAATQTDASGEADRRNSTYHDGSNGHQHKSGRFGSYSSGRERGRGGARGGRGSYANGHQFPNGHMSAQSSPSFAMGPRSPTVFNPENPSFFAAPQGKYGRNGHRSQQSITTDPYRYAPYQAGPPVPPLQTYNMYDYGMVQQPMSAVPYTPYVDQFALFQMITTQVEYYFSVDNLLKDMYLRRHMDSQGFVSLDFIASFNRIKSLSSDIELVKLVCQQSAAVQYRTGEDGQDRLRRREGWEQWVLKMADRDASAQTDGPKELRHPPVPHPSGFDQSSTPQWPMSAVEPMGPYAGNISFAQMNGYSDGESHENIATSDNLANGTVQDSTPESVVPNGHPVEASTKAVSPEPDSFLDAHVASLMVIVRKQDQLRDHAPSSPISRTSSNGSIDSNSDVQNVSDRMIMCPLEVGGIDSSESIVDGDVSEDSCSVTNLLQPALSAPLRLYWVKDQERPIHSLPFDHVQESYCHLRSKALQQRHAAPVGTTPYDMNVLYQFWSHFLTLNHNTQMYNEFRHFAMEDSTTKFTDVGLSSLITFYGKTLLSTQDLPRYRIIRHYVDLVKAETGPLRPAFEQLQSALRNDSVSFCKRQLIVDLLDDQLLAALVSRPYDIVASHRFTAPGPY